MEELYSHYERPRTAILMGHARGVICLAAAEAGIPVVHYSATQIKRILTGSGRAPKSQVQRAIQRELALAAVPDPPDVADALAAALCHYYLRDKLRSRECQFPKLPIHHPSLVIPSMITKITGQVAALHGDTLTLKIDAFEYEVLIPEFTRRQFQSELNQTVSLHTIEYLEGNPMQGRMTPRLIGFLSEVEREFFELVCSVDGVGVKKALRAMVRPVKEVATAIEEQDAKGLSALPGIGPAMAERIIAKLRRKVPKFALMVARDESRQSEVEPDVVV